MLIMLNVVEQKDCIEVHGCRISDRLNAIKLAEQIVKAADALWPVEPAKEEPKK